MVGTAATVAAGWAVSVGSTIPVETLHYSVRITNVAIGATIFIKIWYQSELTKKTNMNKNSCVETARMLQNMLCKNEYLIAMMSWAWEFKVHSPQQPFHHFTTTSTHITTTAFHPALSFLFFTTTVHPQVLWKFLPPSSYTTSHNNFTKTVHPQLYTISI